MKKNHYRIVLFLLGVFLYIFFLSPSVSPGDSGELISAACTLGIPHPPGYPFYMILGRLFTMLIPGNPALGLNLLSMVLTISSAVIIFEILGEKGFPPEISFISAVIFLVHPIFFKNALISEVYSMVTFFFVLQLFLLARSNYRFLAFLTGLSIFVHPLLWFFALYLVFKISKENLFFLIYTAAGLSIGLYIPIRAGAAPFINWGSPDNISSMISHLFRIEYYGNNSIPFSLSVLRGELLIYLKILLIYGNFLLLLLPFAFKKKEKIYLLLLLFYSIPLTLLLHFEPTDLNQAVNRVFYIPQFILIILLIPHGLAKIKNAYVPLVGLFLFSVFLAMDWQERIFNRGWTAFDYLTTVYNTVKEENNPVILSRGDDLTFPLLYGEIFMDEYRVKITGKGLKIHEDMKADYSTVRQGAFNYQHGPIYSGKKTSQEMWNFSVRMGRKDPVGDLLYIKLLRRYSEYLISKGRRTQALFYLEKAEETAWLNIHRSVAGDAYSSAGFYDEAYEIFHRLWEKNHDYKGIYHKLYYNSLKSGNRRTAEFFLYTGLLRGEDGNLYNDAGVYFLKKNLKGTGIKFLMDALFRGSVEAGENINLFIEKELEN